MAEKQNKRKPLFTAVILLALLALVFIGRGFFSTATTIHQLLTENKQLKTAITNLTVEDQIGYAKVVDQENENGQLYTIIKFVETARDDSSKRLATNLYSAMASVT